MPHHLQYVITIFNSTDMQQVYVAYTDVDEPENLQKKSVWHVNLSVSVQNDYSEPIFDPVYSPTRAALEGGYCYPQDAIMPDVTPSPYSTYITHQH